MAERLETKVTRIKDDLYGCRVLDAASKEIIVGCQVPKIHIQPAIQEMFRMLNKLGYDSKMATSSRSRESAKGYPQNSTSRIDIRSKVQFYWGGKQTKKDKAL